MGKIKLAIAEDHEKFRREIVKILTYSLSLITQLSVTFVKKVFCLYE